jgi:hypothetical protein
MVISLLSSNSSLEIGQVEFTGDTILAYVVFNVARFIVAADGPASAVAAAAEATAFAAPNTIGCAYVYNIENRFVFGAAVPVPVPAEVPAMAPGSRAFLLFSAVK